MSLLYRILTTRLWTLGSVEDVDSNQSNQKKKNRAQNSRLIWGEFEGEYALTVLGLINSFLPHDVRLVRIEQVDE